MKKIIGLMLCLLIIVAVQAQAPQGINYQAVAYSASGSPVVTTMVSVRLTILDGSATGTVLYQETHQPTTDNTGMFAIVIGNGTVVSGTFAGIPWATGNKWLQTEMDLSGGSSFSIVSNTQFMSTPYALYANQAGTASQANMASFNLPDGFQHPEMVVFPSNSNYTVPTGKNLYLNTAIGGVKVDGRSIYIGGWLYGEPRLMIGVSEGSVVSENQRNLMGFLVDKKVQWQTINLIQETFTVPSNKVFVVTLTNFGPHGSASSPCSVLVNGQSFFVKELLFTNAVLAPGTTLSSANCIGPSANEMATINGYFMNY
ncbi:MAG TPA: hypothetical protein PKK69_04395 [Ferruginibacter sp.]|nr:hypothetical protein [Ferruginibacter sp.]